MCLKILGLRWYILSCEKKSAVSIKSFDRLEKHEQIKVMNLSHMGQYMRFFGTYSIWALTQENLSSGFPTK